MWEWFGGRRIVQEILEGGRPVRKLLLAADASGDSVQGILSLASQKNLRVERVAKSAIDSLINGNHQGVALEAELPGPVEFKDFLERLPGQKQSYVCLLDEIQDPQNLGAVLRSAAAFGCLGAVIPKWRQAGMTQSVMRASSGAAMNVEIAQISNLGVAVERLKEKGFWIYGAAVGEGKPIQDCALRFPLALILGNEHRGIKPILKKNCDELVTISQTEGAQSLNVSNAAAILFHEIYLQSKGIR